MCTLIAMFGVHPEFSMILAANRDEFYDRGASPPGVFETDGPRIIGGRDGPRGGTWLAVASNGMFAGLTNQRVWTGFDDNRRSRGEVPIEILQAGDMDGMFEYLDRMDPTDYNPFNLLFGTHNRLSVAYVRDDGIAIENLETGIHTLANDRMGSPHFPKEERARNLAEGVAVKPWPELQPALSAICGDHHLPSISRFPGPPRGVSTTRSFLQQLQAICIHTPLYGTRSSTLLALDAQGIRHYLFADGAPCTSSYVELTSLFTEP